MAVVAVVVVVAVVAVVIIDRASDSVNGLDIGFVALDCEEGELAGLWWPADGGITRRLPEFIQT